MTTDRERALSLLDTDALDLVFGWIDDPPARFDPNLLRENRLIGVYTERIAERLARDHDLVARPLSPEVEPLDRYMIWHKRYEADPRHRWFREQMAIACGQT